MHNASSEIDFRPATKSDCLDIVRLYSIASDGVADYIWSVNAKPGEDVMQAALNRYQREDSNSSYKNCQLALLNGEVAGMMLAYPMHVNNDQDDGSVDPVLAPYARLERDNSYYISGMALYPPFRNHGIGSRFLDMAGSQAAELGFPELSLIVFEQNCRAKRLYERNGFREVMRETVVPHPLIRFSGNALLMVKTV